MTSLCEKGTILLAALGLGVFGTNDLNAQEGRVLDIVVHSRALEGNRLGDSADRNVSVYLPPDYDEEIGQRYPVLYLLHGYTGNNTLWTAGGYIEGLDVGQMMNILLQDGQIQPMILVMPSAENAYWGSFYSNSSVVGHWEDFIVDDLVQHIDANYRTLARRDGRGLAGHSMGGYGATKLAMKHPDVYSVVYAMSSTSIAMETHLTLLQGHLITAQTWDTFGGKDLDNWVVKAGIAAAAAFSPNPDNAPFMADFPVEDVDGEVRVVDDVWASWLEHDPLTMIASHRTNLLRYRAIRIDCGAQDVLIEQNRAFARALADANVPHEFLEYEGDNTNRIRQRMFDEVLPFFSRNLAVH